MKQLHVVVFLIKGSSLLQYAFIKENIIGRHYYFINDKKLSIPRLDTRKMQNYFIESKN